MAAVPENLTERLDTLYTTTWQLMRGQTVDNIFKATPLLYRLYNKGLKKESGGRWIGFSLLYGKNTTVDTIGKGGQVNVVNDEIMTTGKSDWKYLVANVIRYFADDTDNQSKQQIMNMLNAVLKTTELSIIEKFDEMLIKGQGSVGTVATNDFDGICTYVKADPTAAGSPGGVDQAANSWWQNKYQNSATAAAGDDAVLEGEIRHMYNDCSVGNDHPTFLIGSQEVYEWYESRLINILRVYDTKDGDMGFNLLKYKGAVWTYSPVMTAGMTDGAGTAVFTAAKHGLFFLNERYLDLVIHSDADFYMTPWKAIPNQLDRVAQIVTKGNFICTNRRMQGLLFDILEATLTS